MSPRSDAALQHEIDFAVAAEARLRSRAPRIHEALDVVDRALDGHVPAHSRQALEVLSIGLGARCDAGLEISAEDLLDVRQFTLFAQASEAKA